MQQHPVIFLDIDEVLWFTRVNMALPDSDGIDPISAGMLRRICDETGSRLVISSTWRCSADRCRTMLDAHDLAQYLWSSIDDPADDWRVEDQNMSRSTAIRNWLANHSGVKVWAIFDDSRQDFDAFMLGRLVHVNALYGIGIHEYRRALKLLGIANKGDGPHVTPRHTIANLASDAIDAIDQGDDDAARTILDTIRNMPLAQ